MQNGTSTPYLLHNEGGNGNHWVVIKPKGVTNNTAGIGARIRAVAGSKSMTRYIVAGDGNANGHLWAHFGLSSATTIDSLIVYWPNGMIDVATNINADKYYTFKEGEGIITSVESEIKLPEEYILYQNYPNPFNPKPQLDFHYLKELMLKSLSLISLGKRLKKL
jgi:hypothetical protein